MKQITNKSRRTGKTSQARSAVRELRKAGYVWADGEWQAPFFTITVPACDEDALRRAFANNKQGMRLMPYAEKYVRKGLGKIGNPTAVAVPESEQLKALKAKTACCMGVGNGDGNLFVYGDYDSIKAAQALVLRAEAHAEVQAEPVIYVSRGQLENHTDPESDGGHYLPARRTPLGLLNYPLYTAPQAQPADALDAIQNPREMADWLIAMRSRLGSCREASQAWSEEIGLKSWDNYTALSATFAAMAAAQEGGAA